MTERWELVRTENSRDKWRDRAEAAERQLAEARTALEMMTVTPMCRDESWQSYARRLQAIARAALASLTTSTKGTGDE